MKQVKITFLIFAIVGIIFSGIAGQMVYKDYTFKKTALHTTGEVIDLIKKKSDNSYVYAPQVSFQTNTGEQITFKSNMSTNPPAFSKGEIVNILYEEHNPKHAQIDSFSMLYIIPLSLVGMGIIFSLLGIVPLFLLYKRKKQIKLIKQSGITTSAQITEIEHVTTYKINKKSPYRIYAKGTNPMNGTEMIFRSDSIWFDPTSSVQIGQEVQILLHPQKAKVYYMDLSFLPNK
mgnify:FL=1